ncbi:MAG TPA: Uma2 family endonuclease [Gammaproteobacteria bacterium]|nr:Uma2 family endonuclease [Gammaproteobacteria bacterium]
MNIPMETWPQRHRITADQYCRMAELGLLASDARVELIEGEIFDMPALGKDHESVVDQLTRLFVRAVADLAIVRVQGSLRLSDLSMPQPDVVLLKPRADFYRSRRAGASDALLVVEVSDSTLPFDRDVKVPLYARHGIPEVWIVDLRDDRLLVFRSPVNGEYEDKTWASTPAVAAIAALPHVSIDLTGLLEA